MSIFGDIMSAIFGRSAKAETPAAGTAAPSASAAPKASPAPSGTVTREGPAPEGPKVEWSAPVDVAAVLRSLAKRVMKTCASLRRSALLLLKALQNGHRGVFMRAQDLFDEMYASIADRSTRRLLNRLVKVDVLVIDEMGYLNLRPEQTNIFFKLMEERYRQRSTIITTNLDYSEWANFLGNKALVDALLSRLRHQCHTVRIDGPSLRDSTG